MADSTSDASGIKRWTATGKDIDMPNSTKVPPGKNKTRPPRLVSISISGASRISENSSEQYECRAYYSNGNIETVTDNATWQVDSPYAGIDGGLLTAGNVTADTTCTLTAAFGGKSSTFPVTITDSVIQEPPSTTPQRIVIDPITRIEGHLRIEVEVRNGEVVDAWSSGTLFRGIETILQNRNPEEAWLLTQRLCGVCTYVHGSTSVRCVENALNLTVPDNARIIRNLLMGAQYLHDHIIHFYHLHALDWVDLLSALQADPAATADIAGSGAAAAEFKTVQERLQSFVAGGQLGPFANHYWPHEAFLLTAEENLMLAAHYLKALELQARTARMHAIFGGKNPHPQSLRVGGVTCRYDLNSQRIDEFRNLLSETTDFIDTVYLPDVILLAQAYSDWAAYGGNDNFLAYGEFPEGNNEPADLFFPRGVIMGRGTVSSMDASAIMEHVKHSWYSGSTARHPSNGETLPNYTKHDTQDRYSWLKAPRYQGDPMEVGPLARMLVAYGSGQQQAVTAINNFLEVAGLEDPTALFSTLGRTAARALETQIIAHAMVSWLDDIQTNGATYQSYTMPTQASGMGLNEAPRGAVGHWINIQNQKIGNYQMVIPSTWNFGPRCGADKPGPAESALIGTPVADPERPVEILRTIHSLDPCIACAVHVIDPRNNKDYTIRVY